jgi:DNA-binding GntR family transcriptional regulator
MTNVRHLPLIEVLPGRGDVMSARRFRPTDAGEIDVETAVLQAIDSVRGPVGARDLGRALAAQGRTLSEATISRRLREMDELDLTLPAGRKGRLLTAHGSAVLRSRLRGREHHTLLDRAADVRTAADVLHLLQGRRAIEPEAVRHGAGRADPASLARLAAEIEEHREALSGEGEHIPRSLVLDFHRTMTSFTDNPLVAAMTRICLDPSLDHVEAMLDVILQTRHTSRNSVAEHAAIYEAFAAGDGDGAAAAMRSHLDRLIAETTSFVNDHDPELVSRLLESAGKRQ